MICGYARVSTRDQNLARQIQALSEYGCERIYADKASGRDFNRTEYLRMRDELGGGDVLIVKSLDRFGRDYDQIVEEWKTLGQLGVGVKVLDMPLLDTTQGERDLVGKLIGDIVLELLSFVAEQERSSIRQRQAEGIALAQARGVRFGRPPKKRPRNFERVMSLHCSGYITKKEAAARLHVAPATFSKWVRESC